MEFQAAEIDEQSTGICAFEFAELAIPFRHGGDIQLSGELYDDALRVGLASDVQVACADLGYGSSNGRWSSPVARQVQRQ